MPRNYKRKHPNKNLWLTSSENPQLTTLRIIRRNGSEHDVLVDTVDVPKVQGHVWHLLSNAFGYVYVCSGQHSKGNFVMMHRIIANTPEHEECFFKNHNPLDCRAANLGNGDRVAVCANGQIRKAPVRAATGHRWIMREKRYGRYHARGYLYSRLYFIGSYATLAEAVEAQRLWYIEHTDKLPDKPGTASRKARRAAPAPVAA